MTASWSEANAALLITPETDFEMQFLKDHFSKSPNAAYAEGEMIGLQIKEKVE